MKGGLVILLAALEVLEASSVAQNIGWEVLINPDEEIGSLGSRFLICEAAQRNHIGLLFEPALPDGALVSERKGSVVFTIIAKGTAAHVGRDFNAGHNAIAALARLIVKAEAYMADHPGVLVNIGEIEGGQAVNVVPDLAVCRINIRVNTSQQIDDFYAFLTHALQHENKTKGLNLTLHEQTSRPPKHSDSKTQHLFFRLQQCANSLGYPLEWRPSGGVCDGNLLAAAGLPVVDTLGAIGGSLHTYDEFVLVDSIIQRARMTALFLLRLAGGEIDLKDIRNE
jgi:glutamate carboxypeptidase